MATDYAALRAALQAGDLVSLSDAEAAAKLNTETVSILKPGTYLAEGGILLVLGPTLGDATLSAIEQAAAGNSLLARIVRILRAQGAGGIDVGDPVVQAQLDGFVAAGIISAEAAAALKAHGATTISRAEAIPDWESPVTEAQVHHARTGV